MVLTFIALLAMSTTFAAWFGWPGMKEEVVRGERASLLLMLHKGVAVGADFVLGRSGSIEWRRRAYPWIRFIQCSYGRCRVEGPIFKMNMHLF
jgi:hypothetical protein